MPQQAPNVNTFKQIALISIFITLILLNTMACQVISQTATAPQPTTETSINSTTAHTEATSSVTVTDEVPNEPQPFSAADLVICFQEQNYLLLEDAAGLLQALGEGFAYSEADSCVYDGMDKTFDYGNICIYTIPAGSTDLLDGVDIYDNSVTTARGIAVGATRELVLQVYGPQAGQESDLIYNISGDSSNLGEPKLTFILEEDLVVAISYYSGSNFQD